MLYVPQSEPLSTPLCWFTGRERIVSSRLKNETRYHMNGIESVRLYARTKCNFSLLFKYLVLGYIIQQTKHKLLCVAELNFLISTLEILPLRVSLPQLSVRLLQSHKPNRKAHNGDIRGFLLRKYLIIWESHQNGISKCFTETNHDFRQSMV